MSNIYDKSSLVLIPSGTKTGKVFSQKPVSGDGDFTFTRSSAATRVNADGNIEKETQNLLTYSNEFTNSVWGGTSAYSLTSGQSGYDGSSDAWEFDKSSSGNNYITRTSITNVGVVTASIYAKAGTADGIMLYTENGYGRWNLSTGSLINSGGSNIDNNIEDIGNGWYRCSVTASSASQYFLKVVNSSGLDTSGSVFVQDAQLEQGLVARDYIETTTAAVYGGITDNTPRLDYTDSSCPALLLEPQRTNDIQQSEYIKSGVAGYTIVDATITTNATTSPEGLQNATLFECIASNDGFYNFTTGSAKSVGDKITLSLFAKIKSGSSTNIIKMGYGGVAVGGDGLSRFNISTGTITYSHPSADSVTIEDYGNGWYRLEQTQTCTAAGSAGAVMYSDGAADFHIWGVQSEVGSYATSYIPTYGSSVSRVAEASYATGASDVIGQTEGTMFIDFVYTQGVIDNRFSISSNNAINWVFIGTPESGHNNSSRFYIRVNNIVVVDVGASSYFTDGQRYKLALAYKSGDWAVYGSGSQLYSGTTTIPSFTSSLHTINFKSFIATASISEKERINQVLLFKTRLSNEELADLTTI